MKGDAAEARPLAGKEPSERAEEALVARARQGDAGAFEELYVSYRDRTYNLCLSLCRDSEEAQDLLQETFVRAYRSLPRFRGDARFSTWLQRITVNLFHDWLRKRRKEAELPAPVEAAPPDDSSAESVCEALAHLSPPYRTVLALRYTQSLSYQEIAEVLGWSLPRVKVTLYRAKAAFKDVYTQGEKE